MGCRRLLAVAIATRLVRGFNGAHHQHTVEKGSRAVSQTGRGSEAAARKQNFWEQSANGHAQAIIPFPELALSTFDNSSRISAEPGQSGGYRL